MHKISTENSDPWVGSELEKIGQGYDFFASFKPNTRRSGNSEPILSDSFHFMDNMLGQNSVDLSLRSWVSWDSQKDR